MILTELIGSVHTFIAAFYYSLLNAKNIYMAICMYKQLQIPSSEDFQQFHYTGKERENSCTNFFNSSLSCHQLEPPEIVPNRES